MSTPRICDNRPYCVNDPTGAEPWKRIFSELDEDWATGSMTLNRRDRTTGTLKRETVAQDTCPACTNAKLGIKAADKALDDAEAARAAKLDPRYVDWLERQNQVGPYAITQDATSG